MTSIVTGPRGIGAILLGAAVLLSGCQVQTDPGIPSIPPPSTPLASAASADAVPAQVRATGIDNMEFFSQLRLDFGSADTVSPPRTLREGAQRSTAVIRGSIVGLTRNGGEFPRNPDLTGDDPTLVVHVRVLATISGSLPDRHPQVIKVARLGLGVDDASLTRLAGSLPQGEQVWFVRWLGTMNTSAKGKATPSDQRPITTPALFAMTHNELLVTQGPTGVSAPWADPDRPPGGFADEVKNLTQLDDVATIVR
ncbi:MAG: hypothetical protein JNL54_22175 [Kineosporiaceae bacterium]|nr:hypothetical protein [Kineosporiaceae bacterium]